jgi:hypothetical protein
MELATVVSNLGRFNLGPLDDPELFLSEGATLLVVDATLTTDVATISGSLPSWIAIFDAVLIAITTCLDGRQD